MYPSMRGDGPEDYEVVEGSILTVTREVEVGGCNGGYGELFVKLRGLRGYTKPPSTDEFHVCFY